MKGVVAVFLDHLPRRRPTFSCVFWCLSQAAIVLDQGWLLSDDHLQERDAVSQTGASCLANSCLKPFARKATAWSLRCRFILSRVDEVFQACGTLACLSGKPLTAANR